MTPPPAASLVERLTRPLILWMGGLWLLAALGTAWYVRQEITEAFDTALVESAWRLVDLIDHEIAEHGQGFVLGEPPQRQARDFPLHVEHHRLVYQVYDDQGRQLLRSIDAPVERLQPQAEDGFSDHAPWRVFTLTHGGSRVRIHVADPLRHRRGAERDVVLGLLLPLFALLPLVAWLIRHIARRQLASVGRLADQIHERSDRNLAPLSSDGLPAELTLITERTNHLLQRLSDALDTERALAANAAHELRTPLATARLRLESAQAHALPEPARQELQLALDSLHQLGRRTEKLLQMSRAESGAALARVPLDLTQVAAAVAQEFWADPALLARLQLQVPEDGEARLLGDVDAVAIVIRNLVENAVRHAPEGPITLAVECPATLRVSDHGPGIAPEQIEHLLQRHRRDGSRREPRPGYGLGLSIVHTIVTRQGGTLVLQSPPPGQPRGLAAVVHFAPHPAPTGTTPRP